ncbi:plasmid stabilization protein ParE [Brachybacterium endophyticum]|uniref:Toxin n=1 Tax=Brachybacterium endophyticum TaxID=2182385 RepID=A0A2U2RHM1_9MICO|nr:type II toxin-antitoxin system RelE/ParE family toxin [Brachybacterium endophyticum]PWH05350.1 plasmid stabilization protein ParE [Brachybacterium endophyticum]
MSALLFTPAARVNLSEIWDYTEEHWDAGHAETYVLELHAAAERVAQNSSRGRPADEVRAGYRRYGIGRHLLFYLVRDDAVVIVRILHQRMDPTRHL